MTADGCEPHASEIVKFDKFCNSTKKTNLDFSLGCRTFLNFLNVFSTNVIFIYARGFWILAKYLGFRFTHKVLGLVSFRYVLFIRALQSFELIAILIT